MGDAAKITCPNQLCQAPNPEGHRFCHKCRTPLIKRYLWALGDGIQAYKPGKLLADRYLLKRDRILLDTKPGFVPLFPNEVTDDMLPYLRLFPYRLHIPQIYGQLPPLKKTQNQEIWLLEGVPIFTEQKGTTPSLRPQLATAWKEATAMRQLNWLWQIAQLWQPFRSFGVAASLLEPQLLRVENQLLRLLELRQDRSPAELADLGRVWLEFIPQAKPAIAEFLAQLCQQMIDQQIADAELTDYLDRALLSIGNQQTRTYQIVTQTDTGPTRQRNEDACYPPSGSFSPISFNSRALAIVCDGIGGHEGGNVASNLAIETVVEQLVEEPNHTQTTDTNSNLDLSIELENSVCQANDRISNRNDSEERFDRQRMGTTLVMALAQAHEMYITHIGDSRVYWITRSGCYQVTLDDDVATREVRLGYSLYREALQQLGSGSLVQALGMSRSNNLHPTVQRFILDEDSIFLLCSDGLSDNERVDQYWDTEILPVLEGKLDLPTVAAKLIEIANSNNGHDNVTVALVYTQVKDLHPQSASKVAQVQSRKDVDPSFASSSLSSASTSTVKTQLLIPGAKPRFWPLLAGIMVLLGIGAILGYLLLGKWGDFPVLSDSHKPQINPHSPSLASPIPIPAPALETGSLILIQNTSQPNSEGQTIPLLLYRALPSQSGKTDTSSRPVLGIVPPNSILEIKRQVGLGQQKWVKLKVCTIPASQGAGEQKSRGAGEQGSRGAGEQGSRGAGEQLPITKSSIPTVKPAQEGWVEQVELQPHIRQNEMGSSAKLDKCTDASPATGQTAN